MLARRSATLLRASRMTLQRAAARAQSSSVLPAAAAGSAVAALTFGTVLQASDGAIHPPELAWSHNGYLDAFDAASLRRGHQVYTQVCASCHGLSRIAYRNLVGVCYSEAEMKAIAEDTDVQVDFTGVHAEDRYGVGRIGLQNSPDEPHNPDHRVRVVPGRRAPHQVAVRR